MQPQTFKTQVFFKDLNGESINVKSPKTGKWIQIFKGWFPQIDSAIMDKIFDGETGWWEYERKVRANSETVWQEQHYRNNNPFTVELTAEELTALYNIYTAQQKKLRRS